MITAETTDADVLNHRARALAALEQWDLARADWSRAVREQPELNGVAFESFYKEHRLSEAAKFGLRHAERHPDDFGTWEKLSPILLLSGNHAAWQEQCRRAVEQFGGTNDAHRAAQLCRFCLLSSEAVDLERLPRQFLADVDLTTTNNPGEIEAVRGLLAYRSGDFQAAPEYVRKSRDSKQWSWTKALSYCVEALAQHSLGEFGKAATTLNINGQAK